MKSESILSCPDHICFILIDLSYRGKRKVRINKWESEPVQQEWLYHIPASSPSISLLSHLYFHSKQDWTVTRGRPELHVVLPISQVNETQAFVLWVLVISTIANRHHFAFLFPQITCNLNWITLSLRYLTKKERKAFSTIVFWCGASEWLCSKVLCLPSLTALWFSSQGGSATDSFQRHLNQMLCSSWTPIIFQFLMNTIAQSNNVTFWQIQMWWGCSVQQCRLNLV